MRISLNIALILTSFFSVIICVWLWVADQSHDYPGIDLVAQLIIALFTALFLGFISLLISSDKCKGKNCRIFLIIIGVINVCIGLAGIILYLVDKTGLSPFHFLFVFSVITGITLCKRAYSRLGEGSKV